MGCKECGKPKCNGKCGCKSPKVLQINNPAEYITFHKVSIPAAMGDSTTNPPKIGAYRNALVYYEADHTSWMYSTDGIPTKLTNGLTDYNEAVNLPQINGHTLIGDQSSSDLGLQGELTAGANIQINNNVISATDTTYTAGNGIELDGTEIKAKIGDGLEFDNNGEIDIADIEQYAHFFDTVADMQAADLSAGEFAVTAGYYAANDGGAAKYKIVDSGATADGGSIIALNNNLKAELILTDPINVKTFGAYGDDTHDDTQVIQKAINFGFSKGIYTTFLPAGEYKTTDPIYLLEKCELRGEDKNSATIHKTANGTGSVSGINADAIIILADSTYATGTTVTTDVRNSEKINNLRLVGCTKSYTSGKSDAQKQYGIWCIGYAPKTAIDNLGIANVDVGIQAVGMYVSHISDIFGLHAFYAGIKITNESQGIIVSNINTLSTHDVGIMLCGATYGSMQACLVEWTYGGYAYRFSNWHGEMNGCGYELGDGPHIGISAVDSKISLVGGYFYSGSPNESNNTMISLSGSSFTLRDSVIGTYNQTIQYNGKFFDLYNSNIVIDETNKFFGSFAEDSVGEGAAFCTINGKTYDVLRDSVLLSSGPTNAGDKYDYIDSDFNSTKKHPRVNIYTGNVSNPFTNDVSGRNNWGPAYNKGDIGFYKNAYATGKLGWFCNRDNHSDVPESAGTISAVADNSITLTDPFTVNFSTTGTRFFVNCKIKGVTSNATARISWISNSQFGITEKTGTFQVGEKIQMVSENFWVYADYLQIPLILAGTTMYRPSTSVSIGTMYFDTTLNKPIWYKGSNTWVDATGATV